MLRHVMLRCVLRSTTTTPASGAETEAAGHTPDAPYPAPSLTDVVDLGVPLPHQELRILQHSQLLLVEARVQAPLGELRHPLLLHQEFERAIPLPSATTAEHGNDACTETRVMVAPGETRERFPLAMSSLDGCPTNRPADRRTDRRRTKPTASLTVRTPHDGGGRTAARPQNPTPCLGPRSISERRGACCQLSRPKMPRQTAKHVYTLAKTARRVVRGG